MVFQWKRCSSSDPATCTTNVGTNSQWYTPVAGDVGKYLRVTATLTTGGQSVSASTAVSAQVASNVQVRRSSARAAVAKSKAGIARAASLSPRALETILGPGARTATGSGAGAFVVPGVGARPTRRRAPLGPQDGGDRRARGAQAGLRWPLARLDELRPVPVRVWYVG